jgi:hypothetical protein
MYLEFLRNKQGGVLMAKQSNARRFGIDFGFGATAKSAKTLWKPLLVAAPLIGTALLLATGTQAQTSASTTPPAQTADTATVAPNPAPDAARKKGPKGRSDSGRTEAALEPDSAPAEERRREGPKGDSGSGRTEVPAPDSTPAEGRREGPKGAVGHGRTEAPAPDTQPTGRRREGPKGDVDHGRTSTTPLIIGALGAATVLALVVSSGNDRPASP